MISTVPRFRSTKSAAGAKLVKDLVKHWRFPRGSLRYVPCLGWV